ncbi:hypothetical protein CGZ80_11405 [Rhodopirellula sp. MGV]|nr:hypothetical protein CGZ80_11405 [Rhodopirellula sp. MGV]
MVFGQNFLVGRHRDRSDCARTTSGVPSRIAVNSFANFPACPLPWIVVIGILCGPGWQASLVEACWETPVRAAEQFGVAL